MNHPSTPDRESGFTLIEALVAMVILLFGIAAISNLMVVAGTSNTVANHATAAASAASRQMEVLKAVPYATLSAAPTGGNVDTDQSPPGTSCAAAWAPNVWNCDSPATEFQGVGTMHVRWSVTPVGAAAPGTFLIQVSAESAARAVGRRSRAFFTTLRSN